MEGETDEHAASRAALQFACGEICASVGGIPLSGQSVSTLTQIVLKWTAHVAQDLRYFTRHGKRTTISPLDVLLVGRKSPSLQSALHEFCKEKGFLKKHTRSKKKRKVTEGSGTSEVSTGAVGDTGVDRSDVDGDESNVKLAVGVSDVENSSTTTKRKYQEIDQTVSTGVDHEVYVIDSD
eukprot:74649_1